MCAVKRIYREIDSNARYQMTSDNESKPHFRTPFGKRWMRMSFEAHIQLAKTPGIFTNDFRVFHLIMPSIHEGNMVYINQSSIAKELGMPASVVSRSLRNLISKGILERSDSPNPRLYQLNPHFAWYRSDNMEHMKALKRWDRDRITQ